MHAKGSVCKLDSAGQAYLKVNFLYAGEMVCSVEGPEQDMQAFLQLYGWMATWLFWVCFYIKLSAFLRSAR